MQKAADSSMGEDEQTLKAREVCAALRHGISEEALAILKREFGYGLPVFEWEVDGLGRKVAPSMSTEERTQRALHLDGAHKVIAFIEFYRKAFEDKPSH